MVLADDRSLPHVTAILRPALGTMPRITFLDMMELTPCL